MGYNFLLFQVDFLRYFNQNELISILVVFIILLIFYLFGFRRGKKDIKIKGEKHLAMISNIQSGLMGLLGVMLAFSFSLSSTRFEYRRQLIIQESMNIGTAFFRAGLLPDSIKKDVRNLLQQYLDERIRYYKPGNSDSEMEKIQDESRELQVKIWFKTAVIGKNTPTLNTNITILALNEMIDTSGNISSSFQNHVPRFILILLVFVSLCTIFTMGYCHGFSLDINMPFAIILSAVICSILLLIIDMDAPNSGFLRADTYGLIELRQEIRKYPH